MGSTKTEFNWEGDDQSKVLVQLLPLGYAIGKYLPADEEELKKRLDKYFPVLDRGATTDHILLPNGHDQMPVQKNIFEIMEKIEKCYPGRKTVLSRYEDVFDEIEKGTGLDTLHGEFLDGKYMRVHRSIYSSRADLKSANTRIENKITSILEPLAAIAYSLGFEYHHGLIEAIWKELLKNHAHDSIGCCCSDKVHRAIADRFFLAEDRTDNLIEFYKRKIVDSMSVEDTLDKFTVFNTLPYPRKEVVTGEIITKMKCFSLVDENGQSMQFEVMKSEIVDAGLIDRQIVHYGNYDPFVKYTIALEDTIPAMGYKTYLVKESAESMKTHSSDMNQGNVLENSYYKIRIEKNGTLTVEDKKTGVVYPQVLLVEDGSDDGDEYDFSPLEDDFILTNSDAAAEVKVTDYQYLSKADIAFAMAVPKDLESRKAKKIDGEMKIAFHIELKKDSSLIQITMDVDNHAKDHRVRVMIPNQLAGNWSVSDNQFGTIRRPVVDEAMAVWEKEKWSERPDSIYPFLSFVHLEDEDGLAVLTNSVREYEIVGENYDTIALTIFRGVGVLGKENLYRRPGRPSGIKMETPDSQMMGQHSYAFAITTDIRHAARQAKEYTTPLVTYNKMPYNAMKLNASPVRTPYTYSLMKLDNPSVTVSVLKKEEQGEGLLLRCYNATKTEQTGTLETSCDHVGEARLDEKPLDHTDLSAECGISEIVLKPNQVRTLVLR
jgi:mannosylglycerate hydrolase